MWDVAVYDASKDLELLEEEEEEEEEGRPQTFSTNTNAMIVVVSLKSYSIRNIKPNSELDKIFAKLSQTVPNFSFARSHLFFFLVSSKLNGSSRHLATGVQDKLAAVYIHLKSIKTWGRFGDAPRTFNSVRR